MDPFFGSFPLGIEERYKYPVNRILSLNTPLEIDFVSSLADKVCQKETLRDSSSQKDHCQKDTGLESIDSLFDSESELSEISLERQDKKLKLKNPFKELNTAEIEKDFKKLKEILSGNNSYKRKSRIVNYRKSDDHCTVCLGKGEVVCCDSCPRVFHLNCLNQILNLNDKWECKECTNVKENYDGIFKELLQNLNSKNPRIFQLPAHIINSFDNIIKHPKTGDFLLKSDVEFINLNSEKQIRDRNPTIKSKREEMELLKNAYCFKCSRSNLKLSQNNLLYSYSINQPKKDLIKCDFCPLFWHLDCLDPPLAIVPPELRENEIEIVDSRSINVIKEKIWGKDSVDSCAGTLNSRSILDGLVSIRKKWMCPCHSQNVGTIQSSGWKWCTVYEHPGNEVVSGDDIFLFSNSSCNNGSIEVINEQDTDNLFEEMEQLHSKRTIGPIDRFEINGIRYRVPEKRIKLDFFAKSTGLKYHTKRKTFQVLPNGDLEFDRDSLDHMFPGFDSKVHVVNSDDSLEMLLEAAKNMDESSSSLTEVEEEYLAAMSKITNPSRMKRFKAEPCSIVINPDDPEYAKFLEWKNLKKSSPTS